MPRDGSESRSRYFLRRKRLHRRGRADGGMPRPRKEKTAGAQAAKDREGMRCGERNLRERFCIVQAVRGAVRKGAADGQKLSLNFLVKYIKME